MMGVRRMDFRIFKAARPEAANCFLGIEKWIYYNTVKMLANRPPTA
jgi:hypothetical protein